MNISEFAKPVTAKSLNESLARRYKTKINLESYTLSQLQNARNILRTKLSQVEVSESFSTVIESESYQKSKLMLDILNAAISERGDIDDEVLEAAKPDYIDIDGDGDTEEPMKKAVKDKEKKASGKKMTMDQKIKLLNVGKQVREKAKEHGVQPSQFLGYLVAKDPEKYGALAKLESIIDGQG